jgi:hypothetical protein
MHADRTVEVWRTPPMPPRPSAANSTVLDEAATVTDRAHTELRGI